MTTPNDKITLITGAVSTSNLGDDPNPELYQEIVTRYLRKTYPNAALGLQFVASDSAEWLRVFAGDELLDLDLSTDLDDCYTEYVNHPAHEGEV